MEKQKSKKNEGEKVTRRKGIFMPEYEMVWGILSWESVSVYLYLNVKIT